MKVKNKNNENKGGGGKKFKKPNHENRFKFNNNLKKTIRSSKNEKNVIDKKTLEKYSKGSVVEINSLRRGLKKHQLEQKEKQFQEAEETAARAEVLLTETSGLLEAKRGTYTTHITQRQIKDAVDITTASKGFELHLKEFGPYKFRYSQNGRDLALGGRRGHIASFDWVTKKLHMEINVMEAVHDVCLIHMDQMMAVAQKEWTYIYDHEGTEVNCIKHLHQVLKLEFLPHHYLLCGGSETGYLGWIDITLGKEVLQTSTRKGRLNIMCQNPYNGVICCGHPNGTVTMWTPNTKKPVVSMFCHFQPIRSITVDPYGKYLATASIDRTVRIWDVRKLDVNISSYKIPGGVNHMSFSQKGLLAVSYKDVVEVYKDATLQERCEVYMRHKTRNGVTGLQFCPYEDVLGCSLYDGYTSLIIPGSGEPNFDALEANPYRSVAARKETTVKALLEKVPYETITLDPLSISQIDVPTLEEKLEAKKSLKWVKVPKIDVQPRYRMKGKSGSAQKFKRKLKVKEDEKREYLKFIKEKKRTAEQQEKEPSIDEEPKKAEVLDRFKSKRKT